MTINELINNSSVQYFEGIEKLLEIWFPFEKDADLRRIPKEALERILKGAGCKIINTIGNNEIDAHLLSESSMFISKNRIILKTCGTTTPLSCLPTLLLAIEQYAGYSQPERIFYSHKNYKHPELQIGAHQDFDKEVALLNGMFSGGSSYRFGTTNKDCWYIYMYSSSVDNNIDSLIGHSNQDQTLEVLMFDLDPQVMSIFTQEKCSDGLSATQKSGIDKIVPGMVIDSFLFDPCGYSMNGINSEGYYMTIHITPEVNCSYVSFETNIPITTYRDMISKVLDVFHPNKFIITLVGNGVKFGAAEEIQNWEIIKNWKRNDVEHRVSQNYNIIYALYSNFPS